MSLIVKICGLKTPEALDAALDAGADMVGFVFFAPSPRHIATMDQARALAVQSAGRARRVALTVDASDGLIDDIVVAMRPDLLQLHGHESPGRVETLRRNFGVPIMKALPVAEVRDLGRIAEYKDVADWLLFDARAPKDATRPGGLGQPFDWNLLKGIDVALPYLLSGGLTPENVAEALRITGAPGVDVSSGVERAPGEKDADKIRNFIRAARAATTTMSNA